MLSLTPLSLRNRSERNTMLCGISVQSRVSVGSSSPPSLSLLLYSLFLLCICTKKDAWQGWGGGAGRRGYCMKWIRKGSGNRVLGIHPTSPHTHRQRYRLLWECIHSILCCIQECSMHYQICTTNISLSGPMQPSARLGEPRN